MKWLIVTLKLIDNLILSFTVAVASVGLETKRRSSMQTQEKGATNENETQKFQRGVLSTSLAGDEIQVKGEDGIMNATLENYDRFNHTFQARLQDDLTEVVFPASALYVPGKCS